MTITIPDMLPQLHKGAHEAGSGRACVMNAIAYMNGDKTISDMPSCVYPPFALMAQAINDNICKHTKCQLCESANALGLGLKHDCVTPLCGPCAHKVWMMGVQLIGTAELESDIGEVWRQRQAAIEIGAALVDWEAERYALKRHTETNPFYMISPSLWGTILNDVESYIAGRLPAWQACTALILNAIEEAGGIGVALMARLIQAGGPDLRASILLTLAKRYAESQSWLAAGDWRPDFGHQALAEKMPELVGILRRAAGHAAQADIVITPEQVAKVPVAVA